LAAHRGQPKAAGKKSPKITHWLRCGRNDPPSRPRTLCAKTFRDRNQCQIFASNVGHLAQRTGSRSYRNIALPFEAISPSADDFEWNEAEAQSDAVV
jgi:hypothetical protein